MVPNKDSSGQGLGADWGEASARGRFSWQLWAFLLVPWALDLIFRTGVLTTLLGASLWGIALLSSVILPGTRDRRLRDFLEKLLMILALGWALNWGWALLMGGAASAWLRPLPVTLLIKVHAALLAAGLGMVLVLWLASGTYLLQNQLVQADSWQRRGLPFRLPSLESLGRVCSLSLSASLITWGAGLALASLTALLSASGAERWERLLDTPVLVASLLWFILLSLHYARNHVVVRGASLHRIFFVISTVFVLAFGVYWSLHSSSSAGFHRPLKWIAD
jgi:hypothetical protein